MINQQRTINPRVLNILSELKKQGQTEKAQKIHVYLNSLIPKETQDTSCFMLTRTKGGKPRDVFLGPFLSDSVAKYLNWKKTVGEPVDEDAPFFYSPWSTKKDRFYNEDSIRELCKRAFARAGIYGTPYIGRRTHASRMANDHLLEVQVQLGHSSLTSTTHYTHTDEINRKLYTEDWEKQTYEILKILTE